LSNTVCHFDRREKSCPWGRKISQSLPLLRNDKREGVPLMGIRDMPSPKAWDNVEMTKAPGLSFRVKREILPLGEEDFSVTPFLRNDKREGVPLMGIRDMPSPKAWDNVEMTKVLRSSK
jgi:hypothetical protein